MTATCGMDTRSSSAIRCSGNYPVNTLLEVGYYANTAHKLMRRTEGNYALPGPGVINSRRRYTSVQVPTGGILIGPLAGTFRQEPTADSNFNSLQVKVEKRLSHGLSVLASYMFSKTISNGRGESGAGGVSNSLPQDPRNYRAERSVVDEDRPQRLVASYVYELPVGRGKTYLGSANRVVNGVLGGWTTAGILTISSGQLASLTVVGNPSNTGGPDRPNVVHDWHLESGQSLQHWFDTTAFALNAPFTFGNAGRNLLRVRAQPIWISRSTKPSEARRGWGYNSARRLSIPPIRPRLARQTCRWALRLSG